MKHFKVTVLCTVALMVTAVFVSSFVTPARQSRGCEDIVHGYYNVTGGSSDPHVNHPWNDCGIGYIHGLDPRTIELYPTFGGGGGTYTFEKLSSYPSSLYMGVQGGYKAYFQFTQQGQVITIKVTRGSIIKVVSFTFVP